MTRLRWFPCVALLMACGGGGTSESGTGSSSTAPASGTTAGTTSPTSSGTTVDATGGGTGTGAGTTTTAGTTTAGVTTLTTAGETGTSSPGATTTTGSSSGGESSTGEPAGACKAVKGEYGPCDAILGYTFDGSKCVATSGCNCEPDCDAFHPTPVACATACAAAGECREEVVKGGGIGPDEVGPGSLCDEVNACVNLPELKELFPGLTCEPAIPCGADACHLLFQNVLTPEQWTQICAASLLPGVDELYCVVFGP